MKRIILSILLLILTLAVPAQVKRDTVTFTLHCLENQIGIEEDLENQLDSIYETLGFLDTTKVTMIDQAIVVGFTDSKGPKKANLSLSEERARYVHQQLGYNGRGRDIVLGLGEAQPIADNKTAEGRAKNRRVEVTLIYGQWSLLTKVPQKVRVYPDTVIVFEDGTTLQINVANYHVIKHCLKYERSLSLLDLFEDLPGHTKEGTFYNFGKINLSWCSNPCLSNTFLLTIPVPDSLIKSSLKDLKAYVRQLKTQRVKLSKHKNERWYIEVRSYCVVGLPPCVLYCKRNNDTQETHKIKKIRFVAKDGYRIIGASISGGYDFSYKKEDIPRRKVKFKVQCSSYYPKVSVVTIRKNNADTIYYASGTEQVIAHSRRCAKCGDTKKEATPTADQKVRKGTSQKQVGSSTEKKIKNRFLRKKYKFRKDDFKQYIVRKKVKPAKK